MNNEKQPILIQGWPLVSICFQGPADVAQVQAWLSAMDALFEKQQKFGLLTRTTSDSDFSNDARKHMGLWFKRQREPMAKWCVGVARIADQQSALERLAGPKMQAAMPCPIFASTSVQEATRWLQDRL